LRIRFQLTCVITIPDQPILITSILPFKWFRGWIEIYNFEPDINLIRTSVPDPNSDLDPPDPHVLGLPDPNPLVRGMDPDPSFDHQAKIVRKILIAPVL
jgi:hypothetical protein